MRTRIHTCLVSFLLVFVVGSALAQQQTETVEQTNQKIHDLAAAIQNQSGDYVLGGGDLIKIEVFDVPDLSREVRISDTGYISLPLIPVKIRAAGLTPFQLEEKLEELLQSNQLVMHPQVSVFVEDHQSEPITVIGAVQKPMVFQAIRPTSLLEVLSAAGGIAPDAGSVVLVTEGNASGASTPGGGANAHAAPDVITIKLTDLLDKGDPKANIMLTGGDTVTVPRAGIVYVLGGVNHPGGFVMQSDSEQVTALKILALAGGTTSTAKPNQAVIIRKDSLSGKNKEISVDLKKIMARKAEDVHLYANDILIVPDSTGKKALLKSAEVALSVTTGVAIVRAGR